ncbi:ATP-binding protein [Calothrix sp. 336/3]|uniref:PAS domain-containing sensor histidine kinase n=2 Tax=Calothrix sp. 336/3 TaxID=1337936 RepID=UPI00069A644E|nr:ATP-binding protein [Calothrix sp. 336/3]
MASNLISIDRDIYESLHTELLQLRSTIDNLNRQSYEQMQLMVASVPTAIAVFDYRMRYLFASPSWQYEYQIGDNFSIQCQEIIHECLQIKAGINIKEALTLADGQTKWVNLRINPWYDAHGNTIGIIIVAEDVVSRHEAETTPQIKSSQPTEELHRSQQRLQYLAENVPGMLYEIDISPDGEMNFMYVSSGSRDVYGLEPEEILQNAQLMHECVHPEDLPGFLATVAESAQTLQNWQYEWRIFTPSGEEKWLQGFSRPISQENGSIVWYGCVTDISKQQKQAKNLENTLRELKRTQAQLIQSEKMSSLGQMVAGVAHEINNPVNFIHGNLTPACEYTQDLLHIISLYQSAYPNPSEEIQEEIENLDLEFIKDDLVKLLQSMVVGTERIRQIVLSLRNFSRLDEADCKTVDIHEGIESTLMILQNRLKAQPHHPEIKIIREYSQLPPIDCFPGQLNQVFMNLFVNAIDILEEEVQKNQNFLPRISIHSQMISPDFIAIRIQDNGRGIPPEVLPKLFDPFFTTKEVGKGTGLGLSISYQIVVEKHGGRLYCNSVVGEGAEFVIEIPRKMGTLN